MNARNSVLRGQKPNASHLGALQTADNTLRMVSHSTTSLSVTESRSFTATFTDHTVQELLAISDAHVENTLRSQDAAQGKWLAEDPSLTTIQQWLMSR
jgi:hypothetical protein